MRSPPLVIGTVTDLIDENRVIVRSSAGPRFLVGISQSLNIEEIKPGARCTLNQQSLAIVEILPTNYDAQIYGMEVVEAPSERYEEIGGLKKQIIEIREAVELPLKKPRSSGRWGSSRRRGCSSMGRPGPGRPCWHGLSLTRPRHTFSGWSGPNWCRSISARAPGWSGNSSNWPRRRAPPSSSSMRSTPSEPPGPSRTPPGTARCTGP